MPPPAVDAEPGAKPNETAEALALALLAKHAFGPSFFLAQLAGFVRDRCPAPDERLPVVELHLQGGEVVEICHVIGVAPAWVALATRERHAREMMATVLVAYEQITRVEIRAAASEEHRVGFFQERPPRILEPDGQTAEAVLRAASEPRREGPAATD